MAQKKHPDPTPILGWVPMWHGCGQDASFLRTGSSFFGGVQKLPLSGGCWGEEIIVLSSMERHCWSLGSMGSLATSFWGLLRERISVDLLTKGVPLRTGEG